MVENDCNIALEIKDLGKAYKLWQNPRDQIKQYLKYGLDNLFKTNTPKPFQERWALRNINLKVKKGETIGILGKNGAGKSTLLKVLSGTVIPTTGEAHYYGRLTSLLELGSSFNPEYTGRENIYLNATFFGLSTEETTAKLDRIINFAEIGDYIEQPLKTYSSGMKVRLAFSVAVNTEPDILLLDEALSVGDEAFQRKSYSFLTRLINTGVTVLFVSHDIGAVVSFADRAILLDMGEIILEDRPKIVADAYQKLINSRASSPEIIKQTIESVKKQKIVGASAAFSHDRNPDLIKPYFDPTLRPPTIYSDLSYQVKISNPRILTLDGERVNFLVRNQCYQYVYEVDFQRTHYFVRFGMLVKTLKGIELGGGNNCHPMNAIPEVKAGTKLEYRVKFRCVLYPNTYYINAGVFGIIDNQEVFLDRCVDAVVFKVIREPNITFGAYVDFFDTPPQVLVLE